MKALGIFVGGAPMLCSSVRNRNHRFCVSFSSSSSSESKTVRIFCFCFSYFCCELACEVCFQLLSSISLGSVRFRLLLCELNQVEQVGIGAPKTEYKPRVFDDLFLNLFRNKLVQVKKRPFYSLLIKLVFYLN